MGKVICDICGTSYPDTAEQCPICGCTRETAAQMLGSDFQKAVKEEKPNKNRKTSSKKPKEIFDFDEVNNGAEEFEDDEEAVDQDEDYEEENEDRPNTFAVILLTILIVILLLAAGLLFFRFILPNMGNNDINVEPTVPMQNTLPVPTAPVGIPCETLVLSSDNDHTFTAAGEWFLLHVSKVPSNSTDEIIYTSADENVATVTADGRIEAVSEGQTSISITCGEKTIEVAVKVDFSAATEPVVVATEPVVSAETEPVVDVPSDNTGLKTDVVLKVKQSEFKLPIGTYHTLLLDCDLDPSEVEWSTEHSYIAKVDETGKVTAIDFGVTDVIVKYGDQEVRCKVRCG